jgi:drug/metabolite transporter (DMT)-like permease
MIVFLALLAAFVFGTGVVLQQRAAMEVPEDQAARPALLVRLARRPMWVIGLGADVAGFGLQAAALHHGSLILVQPLITTSLLFTLVLTSAWYHEAISRTEWAAVLLVLAGLSVFLIVASPTEESRAIANTQGWLLCTGTVVLATVLAVGGGLRAHGRVRAACLGVSAGIADAFMAVLAKALAGEWDRGIAALVRSWTPYALLAGGVATLLLVSTAYQAGHPTVSLPIITVTDPLVGSLIGILLFGEELTLGGLRSPIVVLALAAMVAGLVSLGRDTRLAEVMAERTPDPAVECRS